MKNLHIHNVLHMMLDTKKTYTSKEDFIKEIENQFGKETKFHACSSTDMNANKAYDFLIKKSKITIDSNQNISLSPDITMCNEHIN